MSGASAGRKISVPSLHTLLSRRSQVSGIGRTERPAGVPCGQSETDGHAPSRTESDDQPNVPTESCASRASVGHVGMVSLRRLLATLAVLLRENVLTESHASEASVGQVRT